MLSSSSGAASCGRCYCVGEARVMLESKLESKNGEDDSAEQLKKSNKEKGSPASELVPAITTTPPKPCQTKTIAISGNTVTISNETRIVDAVVKPLTGPPANYTNRRTWITTERMNELRRRAQEALKYSKTFTIRGCFNSVRNALTSRGWVEKLDLHRKHIPTGVCQVSYDDLAQGLPKRKAGETRSQYIAKCERNIMSRFLEHMPIDFLWTNRKEKCDYIDQAKNPVMTINKFHRAPFTSKEGLCMQLKDFHWFYEEGTAEMYFPRCYNVWSPEELSEFIENFKLTACIAFLRWLIDKYQEQGYDAVFSPIGKIPLSAIDFAYKRCTEFIESCQHNDIDHEDSPKIWEHDWDAFLAQHQQFTSEGFKIFSEQHHRIVDSVIRTSAQLLDDMQHFWPQYSLDGYNNLWIIKPANKCRGRGIQLMDNLKKVLNIVNPSIASKSRYVVQKYIERPLIIHRTKFDIRQWFLVTNVQPMVIWMYKESYLRFSSQEYSLTNHHESVHLTNHAVQKRYTNGKRDKRLPNENMWDCYSFQAYLRQIGRHELWDERIYPGMRKAIVGTMLASQENMDRRPNTFELFGADFMISEDFHPWLIEINSSPDLGATTSVTARMCPQCLEDVIKVVIDRRVDPKAEVGNFELAYRQIVPPTPAYMGLNLLLKGKQLISKVNQNQHNYYYQRKERTLSQSHLFRQRTTLIPAISNVHRVMPTFNATEYIEKCIAETASGNVNSANGCAISINSTGNFHQPHLSPLHTLTSARRRIVALATASTITPCPNLLRTPRTAVNTYMARRRSFAGSTRILGDQQTAVNRKTGELSSSEDQSNLPVKRFRSCGPRLTNNIKTNGADSDQKLKVIIKKCTIQKNLQVPSDAKDGNNGNVVITSPNVERSVACTIKNEAPTATINSKSEPNIVTLLRRFKAQTTADSQYQHISPRASGRAHSNNSQLSLRSQSCFFEKKLSRHTAITAGNNTLTVESKVSEDPISVAKPLKSEKPNSQCDRISDSENSGFCKSTNSIGMHAIGKKLNSWNMSQSQAKLSTKSSSAYLCRYSKAMEYSSDATITVLNNSTNVSATTRPKYIRKRTRSEILTRNTRC